MSEESVSPASIVMSNPNSYPDVFLEIMLAVQLDPKELSSFAGVNRAWRRFIGGYLWRSSRVQALIARKWLSSLPSLVANSSSSFSSSSASISSSSFTGSGIRCLAGDLVHIFAGTYNGKIHVWPGVPSGRRDNRWGKVATLSKGHQGSVFCLSLNPRLLVSGSFDHSVCVWDRLNESFDLIKRLEGTHQDMVYGVAINKQHYILSCSHDSVLSVWKFNPSAYDVEHKCNLLGHSPKGIKAVDVDETYAVSCGRDHTLRLWSLEEQNSIRTIPLCGSPSAVKMLYPQAVVAVKTTNVEDDNNVGHVLRLFDLTSGVGLRNLYGHSDRITSLALDSTRIVSGDENGNILIWDNRNGIAAKAEEETPCNILYWEKGQKVSGLVIAETTSANGDEDNFRQDNFSHVSGLHVATQRGTLLFCDFLSA